MKKGIICYYSTTGNTRLACQCIANSISDTEFNLVDIKKTDNIDISIYDILGIAVSTDFMGPPLLMQTFIKHIPMQNNKPAFVFNTHTGMSGKTLPTLKNWVSSRGCVVIAGHSLRTPQAYPPFNLLGLSDENQPNGAELRDFRSFVARLDELINSPEYNNPIESEFRIGAFNSLLPMRSLNKSKTFMLKRYVDVSLCNECGICRDGCPYSAIELNPKPVFDIEKCNGCWSCFNLCLVKAIYTSYVRRGHYSKPSKEYKRKMAEMQQYFTLTIR